jgi:hypothetical protein
VVAAVGVDVLGARGRQVEHIFVGDAMSLGAEVLKRGALVDGVPEHDGVGYEVEALRLIGLVLERAATDRAREMVPVRRVRRALTRFCRTAWRGV